jgi:hypothetical protein
MLVGVVQVVLVVLVVTSELVACQATQVALVVTATIQAVLLELADLAVDLQAFPCSDFLHLLTSQITAPLPGELTNANWIHCSRHLYGNYYC